MAYNKKMVLCGNVIEVYEYMEPILEGYTNKIEKVEREKTEDVKRENFNRSIKRTARKIRELVNCNFDNNNSSFLTLTFKENIRDYDVAFSYWKRFKQKVERRYDIKLSYLGVVEFQKRGAIHFHICLFNVPYLKHSELYDMWLSVTGGGGVYIEKVATETCDNVGAYVTKYITKDSDDFFDNEYKGKKRYFQSRNLKKPIELKFDTSVPGAKEDFDKCFDKLKNNIVYEYESSPFEIKKKVDCNRVCTLEVLEEDNIDVFGNKNMPGDIVPIILDKKETVEVLVGTQQLKYTQILLNINSENRDKNNKYVYKYNKDNKKNKDIKNNNEIVDIKIII